MKNPQHIKKSQDNSKSRWEKQMFKLFRRKYIYDLSIEKNFLSNPSLRKKTLKTKKANEMFVLKLKSSIQQKTLKTKWKDMLQIHHTHTHIPLTKD